MSVGPWQIVMIALVVLVLFGASRLGDIGKGLGEGIRNFKKGISGEDEDEESSKEPKEPKQLTAGNGSKSKAESTQEEKG
ncbi:MAG: twin-arginine translocase TatA/TatE family subunit [Myxococcales bacterium]|nr:twin-arginine translocase TatA/TatE family subunit [Myxococcales bacterium]